MSQASGAAPTTCQENEGEGTRLPPAGTTEPGTAECSPSLKTAGLSPQVDWASGKAGLPRTGDLRRGLPPALFAPASPSTTGPEAARAESIPCSGSSRIVRASLETPLATPRKRAGTIHKAPSARETTQSPRKNVARLS